MNFFSFLCFHRYKHKRGHTALLITQNREEKNDQKSHETAAVKIYNQNETNRRRLRRSKKANSQIPPCLSKEPMDGHASDFSQTLQKLNLLTNEPAQQKPKQTQRGTQVLNKNLRLSESSLCKQREPLQLILFANSKFQKATTEKPILKMA